MLGSRDSSVGHCKPEAFSLEDTPVLKRGHQGSVQPYGGRYPTSSRHTVASEAQSHGHYSVEVSNLTPESGGLLGVLTGSANRKTDQPRNKKQLA